MYISKQELASLSINLDNLRRALDDQEAGQNNIYPEGLALIKQTLEEGFEAIENVRNREALAMARKIVKRHE